MSLKSVTFGLCALTAVCTICYFAFSSDSELYATAIPDDAVVLAEFAPETACEELGLTILDLFRISQDSNIADMGLDLRKHVYAFATRGELYGCVAAMSDADKFGNYIKQHTNSEPKITHGMTWVDFGSNVICWNKNKALALTGASVNDLLRVAKELMTKSAKPNDIIERLPRNNHSMNMVISGEALAVLSQHYGRESLSLLPFRYEDIDLLLSLKFCEQAVRLTMSYSTIDKNVQANIAKGWRVWKKNCGYNLDRVSDDVSMIVCAGVDGRRLLDLFSDNNEKASMLAMANHMLNIDIERILSALNGDVTMVLDARLKTKPTFVLWAELDNKQASNINVDLFGHSLTVKDGEMTLTNDIAYKSLPVIPLNKDTRKAIKDSYLYVRTNVDAIAGSNTCWGVTDVVFKMQTLGEVIMEIHTNAPIRNIIKKSNKWIP